MASIADGDTPSSSAMKYRSRAESSTPAIPTTRRLGNPATSDARNVISSSGLVTTTITASGDPGTTFSTTSRTTAAFLPRRSMRLMPGCRGNPAVMTTTSDPAVSA
jgi:hypothetical protein